MSLFNTQKKKIGNAMAGEVKLPAKIQNKVPVKAVKPVKALAVARTDKKADEKGKSLGEKRAAAAQGVVFPKNSAVIKSRITEKSGLLSQNGIYTFDVRIDANKKEIAKVIASVYKVTPVKISTSAVKSKAMFMRGRAGKTVSGKKAYVQLKKGETIEFI